MRFLLRLMVWFVSALIGIVVADILLPGFEIDGGFLWAGYLLVALIFAIVQSILAPLTEGLTRRHARAFSGGVGIISTLIALGLTAAVSKDFKLDGVVTWILASLIVWLFGAIAAFLLPILVVRRIVDEER
ncbi:MAG: phage holin family protein [Candidatus Nanopelagicales bacterium]